MTRAEAQIVADKYLAELQKDCPVEISFNYDLTEEHPPGFVFFYNSREFWKSRDFSRSLAGNGPVLVLRDSSNILILPSNQSLRRSLEELAGSPPAGA
jgi:hypothetical protein